MKLMRKKRTKKIGFLISKFLRERKEKRGIHWHLEEAPVVTFSACQFTKMCASNEVTDSPIIE